MNRKHIVWLVVLMLSLCIGGCKKKETILVADREKNEKQAFMYVNDDIICVKWDESFRNFICAENAEYFVKDIYFYNNKPISKEQLYDIEDEMLDISIESEIFRMDLDDIDGYNAKRLYKTKDYITAYTVDEQDGLYVICQTIETFWGGRGKTYLERINASGEREYRRELNLAGQCEYMVTDGKGHVAILSDGVLLCFDPTGRERGKIIIEDVILDICAGPNEEFYVLCNAYDKNHLKIIDAREGREKGKIDGIPANLSKMKEGICDNVLLENKEYVYRFSTISGKYEKLLSWADVNIFREEIADWWMDREEKIRVQIKKDSQRYLITLNKVPLEEIDEKKIITIGVYDLANSELKRSIINYNQTNPEYVVKIIDYMEMVDGSLPNGSIDGIKTRLNLDITTGNLPDIMDSSLLDIKMLVEKGVVEDLTPYLQRSNKLCQEDFMEAIIQDSTYNGVLAYIPKSFIIRTLVGKTSLVGDASGWNCEEWMRTCTQYPEAEVISWMDPRFGKYEADVLGEATVAEMGIILNENAFMDPEKGKCMFWSEEFKEILEFSKNYHVNMLYNYNSDDYMYKHRNNLLLLEVADLNSYYSVVTYRNHFDGEPVNFIGYPTAGREIGNILLPRAGLCIMRNSDKKEACWDFLEYYFLDEDNISTVGFPTQKKMFDKCKKEYLEKINHNKRELKDNEYAREELQVTYEDIELVDGLIDRSVGLQGIFDETALTIIGEETTAFYEGQKALEEVIDIIQNRIMIYINENR